MTDSSFPGATGPLSASEKLSKDHDVSWFDCGKASLNDWLKRFALINQQSAIDDEAAAFYTRFGFEPSSLEPNQLMLLMKDLRASLKSLGFKSGP